VSDAVKRPWEVAFLGALFIVAGLVGLLYHGVSDPVSWELVLVLLVRIVAIVGGVFLILGRGWARWVLIAWLGFHVAISALNSLQQTVAHAVLLAVVAYFLTRAPASDYFRGVAVR